MATDHRGNIVGNPDTSHGGHLPTPRLSAEDKRMKAREESLGEASDYDTEAAYAASYRDDPKPSIERDEFNTGDNWSWLKGEFAENYRRGD